MWQQGRKNYLAEIENYLVYVLWLLYYLDFGQKKLPSIQEFEWSLMSVYKNVSNLSS